MVRMEMFWHLANRILQANLRRHSTRVEALTRLISPNKVVWCWRWNILFRGCWLVVWCDMWAVSYGRAMGELYVVVWEEHKSDSQTDPQQNASIQQNVMCKISIHYISILTNHCRKCKRVENIVLQNRQHWSTITIRTLKNDRVTTNSFLEGLKTLRGNTKNRKSSKERTKNNE